MFIYNGLSMKSPCRRRCLGIAAGFVGLLALVPGAWAETVFLPVSDGAICVDTDNPGPYAASAMPPCDTAGAKAAGVTFNVYYTDVEQHTGIGFDDVNLGAQRRACVVEVLAYISGILRLPDRSCDVRFNRSFVDGTASYYEGGAYFSQVSGFANGYAFEHIWNNHDMSTQLDDIFITMDFGWPWHTGAGSPSAGQLDFRAALLQVLTQGLGLVTLSKSDGSSKLGTVMGYSVWDSLLETGQGNRLWLGSPPQFQGVAANLTGSAGGVFFAGAKTIEFNEGKPDVYTPAVFNSKKSLGFWNKTLGVAMKPALVPGESVREYGLIDRAALYDIGYTSIDMPLTFVLAPRGGWFSVGDSLTLSVRVVGAVGDVSYQWQKDGSDYPGATSAAFTIEHLTPGHEGVYTCIATDASKASYTSPPAIVKVVPQGQLPAMGIIGLCLVAAACILAGALIILRRE